MTWVRALRRELGFIAGMPVGVALFGAGFLLGAVIYRDVVVEQGAALDAYAAQHCILLNPVPRHR